MSAESSVLAAMAPPRAALAVDDDAAMRKLVKDLMAWEGIDTRELPSGEGVSSRR